MSYGGQTAGNNPGDNATGGANSGMGNNSATSGTGHGEGNSGYNFSGDGGGGYNPYTNPYAAPAAPAHNPGIDGGQFENLEQAGVYGANQAFDEYKLGPATPYGGSGVAGFGNTTNNAHNQITGLATGNPYLANATQQVSNLTTETNPFLAGFKGFDNQQNESLDAVYNRGANELQDRMNSQFGGSGRSGSGYHSQTTGNALGDYSASLYGNAYDADQNRKLQALQAGSNAYLGQGSQQMQAASMIPELNNAKFDDARMLQGVGRDHDVMSQFQLDDEINRHNTEQNSGWANLQNYQNVINGLSPTQQQNIPDNDPNKLTQAIGLAGTVASFF